jgi:hypothetical protein
LWEPIASSILKMLAAACFLKILLTIYQTVWYILHDRNLHLVKCSLSNYDWLWSLTHEAEPFLRSYQELPSTLWNPKFHYRVQKSPPLVPTLSQIDPVHTIPSYLRFILILSTHLCFGLCSGLFLSGFPTNILYTFLFAPFLLHALPISSSFT